MPSSITQSIDWAGHIEKAEIFFILLYDTVFLPLLIVTVELGL